MMAENAGTHFVLSPVHTRRFREGRRLFNEGLYWESHEVWEEIWKEESGDAKVLIQGIIQAAAAYHLIFANPRRNGALGNIEKALTKLDKFHGLFLGVDIESLRGQLNAVRSAVEARHSEDFRGVSETFRPRI